MSQLDFVAVRFLFVAVLVSSTIFSVGIIALGVWILADPSLMSYWLNKIVITDYGSLTATLRMTSYMPIGLGLVAILSFSVGVAYLLRGGRTILVVYIVVTVAAVLLELVLTLVPMGMWSQVDAELPRYLQSTLQNEYRGITEGVGHPNSIVWDAMQIELECCGFNGPSDFTKNYRTYAWYWHSQYRHYKSNSLTYSGMSYMFPVSCCRFADKSIVYKMDFANYENYVYNKQCPVLGVDYYGNSCQQPLKDYVYVYFCVILAVSVVMLVLHSSSLILSAYMLRKRIMPEAAYATMSSRRFVVAGFGRTTGKVTPTQETLDRHKQRRQRHRR